MWTITSESSGQRSRTTSSIRPACRWAEGSGWSPGSVMVTSATRPRPASRKLTAAGSAPVTSRTASSMASRSVAVSRRAGRDARTVPESGSMCVCTLRISGTGPNRALEALDDVVRLREREIGRELDVERQLVAVAELEHAHVVHLAHLGDARRRRGRPLPHAALEVGGLDVDDDVGRAERVPDEVLDRVGGGVGLPDPGVGRDRDDEVHEVPAGGMADPHAAQLDRLAQLAQRGADALVGVRGRDVHEHLHRLPQQAQGEGDHEAGDEDARHGVGRRLARRDEGHADQDGGGARQVRREVQGVGRERGRAVAARRAPARHHAARVDADHQHEHGDRPPRRLHRMGAAVDQTVSDS